MAKQGNRVLFVDADAQANLTIALGYTRPDDISVTLSTIMQDIMDDKTGIADILMGKHHAG